MNELFTHIVIVLLLASVLIAISIKAFRDSHFSPKRLLLGMVLPTIFIGGCGTCIVGTEEVFRPKYISLEYCSPTSFSEGITHIEAFLIPATLYAAVYAIAVFISKRSAERTDPTRCKSCGYTLHGLPEPRCPECGKEFER